MDETMLRTIIREEITLAMKTLSRVADDASSNYMQLEARQGEADGSLALASAAGTYFESAYEADTAVADEQRAAAAVNPFEDRPAAGTDPVTTAAIRAEVLDALKDLRSAFYMSGSSEDYRIAERLDGLITARETTDE
ncbi:hypothetical protein ACH4F6_38175 [Streptomyces sp. NPDC017936]|uniref:hypothetical protein n=1 Tax=Streptomyces sp. NPDC017936 TaxID=3365016 RepID=UPI00378AFEA8